MTTNDANFSDEGNRGPDKLRSFPKTTQKVETKRQSWEKSLTSYLVCPTQRPDCCLVLGALPRTPSPGTHAHGPTAHWCTAEANKLSLPCSPCQVCPSCLSHQQVTSLTS